MTVEDLIKKLKWFPPLTPVEIEIGEGQEELVTSEVTGVDWVVEGGRARVRIHDYPDKQT